MFGKFELNVSILLPVTLYIYGNIPMSAFELLTLTRLAFLKVVFSGERVNLIHFIFQEELIQYKYNGIQFLSNLFNPIWTGMGLI